MTYITPEKRSPVSTTAGFLGSSPAARSPGMNPAAQHGAAASGCRAPGARTKAALLGTRPGGDADSAPRLPELRPPRCVSCP